MITSEVQRTVNERVETTQVKEDRKKVTETVGHESEGVPEEEYENLKSEICNYKESEGES